MVGPYVTNKRFCSTECYTKWWTQHSFKEATQQDRIEKQLGPVPDFVLDYGEAMWVACALDGEGSIGIHRQWAIDRLNHRYRAVISVSNTCREFLDFLASLVNGMIHRKNIPKKPHHKECFSVVIKARAIPNLLEQILPYLIIKRKQADLVLEYCRAVAASPVHNRAVQQEFERLYQECKALNKRGTK